MVLQALGHAQRTADLKGAASTALYFWDRRRTEYQGGKARCRVFQVDTNAGLAPNRRSSDSSLALARNSMAGAQSDALLPDKYAGHFT